MDYPLLKFFHIIGLVLIGGGLIGVWVSDLRSRQEREPVLFAEAARSIAVFYDAVVVPGALLLLFSGAWMTIRAFGGWAFLDIPWLAGMILLFAFEFIEGNTITRLYFMRLRRIARQAVSAGHFTPELEAERARLVPTFTHFLDIPILVLIIALGVMRPATWDFFFIGLIVAFVAAFALTAVMRSFYRWEWK